MEHMLEEISKENEKLKEELMSLEKDFIPVCAENQALNRWIDELKEKDTSDKVSTSKYNRKDERFGNSL